jgi:hypothetical protein
MSTSGIKYARNENDYPYRRGESTHIYGKILRGPDQFIKIKSVCQVPNKDPVHTDIECSDECGIFFPDKFLLFSSHAQESFPNFGSPIYLFFLMDLLHLDNNMM